MASHLWLARKPCQAVSGRTGQRARRAGDYEEEQSSEGRWVVDGVCRWGTEYLIPNLSFFGGCVQYLCISFSLPLSF